jgi:hypothetical protein
LYWGVEKLGGKLVNWASCIGSGNVALATVCEMLTAYVPLPVFPVQSVGIGLQRLMAVVLLSVILVPGWIPKPTSVSPTLRVPWLTDVTVSVAPVQGVGVQVVIYPVKDASFFRTADTGTAVVIVVILAVQGWTNSGVGGVVTGGSGHKNNVDGLVAEVGVPVLTVKQFISSGRVAAVIGTGVLTASAAVIVHMAAAVVMACQLALPKR